MDFDKIANECEDNLNKEETWIEEFLVYYALGRSALDKEMSQRLKRFNHNISRLPDDEVGMLKMQYAKHRIFRENGLIRKLVNHVDVKAKGAEPVAYFRKQLENPWRFAFTELISVPAPHFHLHRDVFTEEEYLIYSPFMTNVYNDFKENGSLWFNLLAWNGSCWQTSGPVIAFRSLKQDDVFFFAGEIDDRVSSEEDVLKLIDSNPVPFMMLMIARNDDPMVCNGHEAVLHSATVTVQDFDIERLTPDITVDQKQNIYRLSFGHWSNPVHYANAFIDRDEGECFCFALSAEAFSALSDALRRNNIIVEHPDVVVTMAALFRMEAILGRKISVHPYAALVREEKEYSRKVIDHLERTKLALSMAFEDRKAGLTLQHEKYAAASGLHIDEVRELLDMNVSDIKDWMAEQ
jgi:hypothetical protein